MRLGVLFLLLVTLGTVGAGEEAPASGPKAPEAPPLIKADPNAAVGQPHFPLPPEAFNGIDDGYDKLVNTYDAEREESDIELFPMSAILDALQNSTQQHLNANIDVNASFTRVMNHSEQFRGHVVRWNGVLQAFHETKVGTTPIWKGYTSNMMGQIISFRSLEAPPPTLTKGKSVELVGIFMKRFAYLDAEPGEHHRVTPLIFVRRVEPYVDPNAASPTDSSDNLILAIAICACLGFGFYFYLRVSDKNLKPNHFTRLREQRDPPPRRFPRIPKV